jgi:hypothetical protein
MGVSKSVLTTLYPCLNVRRSILQFDYEVLPSRDCLLVQKNRRFKLFRQEGRIDIYSDTAIEFEATS